MAATARDGQLDVVRAVALLSMFVAHFAPSDGPGGVLGLSEYLTAALFAALVGWSAELERVRRSGRNRARAVLVVVRSCSSSASPWPTCRARSS